jgi:tyrosyl-tRNA synthetase
MLRTFSCSGPAKAHDSDKKELDDLLTDKRIAAYVGVDPTAPSLHIGNLLPIMALLHMFLQGYTAVTVVS